MLRKIIKSQKGQSIVEFAFVIPLLLVLLFGIIEFGRIFSVSLVVTHSAREGARAGAVGADDSAIILRVQEAASVLDTAGLVVTIDPGQGERERGDPFSVHVSYPVDVMLPFITAITGETVDVASVAVMRVE